MLVEDSLSFLNVGRVGRVFSLLKVLLPFSKSSLYLRYSGKILTHIPKCHLSGCAEVFSFMAWFLVLVFSQSICKHVEYRRSLVHLAVCGFVRGRRALDLKPARFASCPESARAIIILGEGVGCDIVQFNNFIVVFLVSY